MSIKNKVYRDADCIYQLLYLHTDNCTNLKISADQRLFHRKRHRNRENNYI